MKITTSQLKQIIKEQIEKMTVSEMVLDDDPVVRIKSVVDKMQRLLDAGEIHKLSELELDFLKAALRSTKARAAAAGRPSEKRSAAAKKAAETRRKNKEISKRIASKWRAEIDRREALLKAREAAELLPLEVDGYAGAPNPDYYDEVNPIIMGPDGFSVPRYKLKPRWVDKKFSPEKRQHALRKARPIASEE